ncbi:RagB/SusD family nutrient uptake outer membrane protein [Xylanibacter brevis]|uniref:RagB/SusD family nutrient uptake outer membrane protein n=1 Tax=Xylanibacter brevis TaxID=83231 RepID=UPI000480D969|nr:RagB/SusD family nutrient uptake outer membrane protein [Xylanibacter brevis]
MKKARILLSAALATTLSLGFVSCSSNDSDNQVTDENVVADDASALSLVNGVYSHWQPLSSSFSFIIELNSNKLISFEGEESEAGPVNSRFEQEPTTWYQVKIFNHLLLGIAQANEAITTINNSVEAGKVTQAGYNAAVGKAKFLRALAYLKLAQLWGEVPVFTENGGSTTERQSIDNVLAQVVKDFTDAESLLKDYDGDPRTPSKQAAQALLARTYLVWGDNPLSAAEVQAIAAGQTDPQFTKTDSRLEKAVEYANKVINSGLLALDPDFSKLYGRDYESNKRGTNEHLFTIAHDGDKVDAQGNHQTHCSWTFPFQNGENGNGYTQNHTEVADDNLYDDWKREQPNDKRLAETYLIEVKNPEDQKIYHYYSPVYTPINGKGVDQSYEDAENLEITKNSVDRIEIRYAEVLLIKAEALVQLGRNSEAAEPFNQLRRRAGIAEVSAPTFEQIKREWDYEFTYEQFSVFNSYRWKDLISSVKKVASYKHFADNWKTALGNTYNADQEAYFTKVHNHLRAKYNNVRGRHYRQPIPTGLSGEDLGIAQNPGY